ARQIRPRRHRIVVVQAQFGCVPPAHQVLVEVQRRQEPSTERMSETVGEQHHDDTSPTAENSTSLADAVRTVTASPLRSGYDPSSNDSPPGRAKSYTFQCTDPPDGVMPIRISTVSGVRFAAVTVTSVAAEAVKRVVLFVSAGVTET